MTGADQQQQLQNYIERILVVFSDRQYFIQCLSACWSAHVEVFSRSGLMNVFKTLNY